MPRPPCNTGDAWPVFRLARELAGEVFPVSEAVILQVARKHGIGRKMGRAIIFGPDDCKRLYEVLPCPSDSSGAPSRHTGSSAAPSAEFALKKALALATGESPKKSAPSAKPKSSHESVYGRRATATFAEAAVELPGTRRFEALHRPVIKHFGTTPLAQIDQDALDRGARKLYPNASPSTRNRQFYTPCFRGSTPCRRRGWCAPPIIERPATPAGRMRWLTIEEADRLIEGGSDHLAAARDIPALHWRPHRRGAVARLARRRSGPGSRHTSQRRRTARRAACHFIPRAVAALANSNTGTARCSGARTASPTSRPRKLDDTSAGTRIKTAFKARLRARRYRRFPPA